MKRTPLKRKPIKKKSKKHSIGWYKKRAWTVFSAWIRKRDNGICFTCGRQCEGSGYHAGHYIPKSLSSYLFFDERNVHGQCYRCNIHLSGNSDEYAIKLGEEMVREIRADKKKYKQWTIPELQGLIDKYREPF